MYQVLHVLFSDIAMNLEIAIQDSSGLQQPLWVGGKQIESAVGALTNTQRDP